MIDQLIEHPEGRSAYLKRLTRTVMQGKTDAAESPIARLLNASSLYFEAYLDKHRLDYRMPKNLREIPVFDCRGLSLW